MKKSFVRAAEVWVLSTDRARLQFGGGNYGLLADFEVVSKGATFGYDEGLPGKAWSQGRPLVLKNLTSSYFRRGPAAAAAGLTCAIAIPIFAGRILLAVLVLLCGDDSEHVGAIEVWHTPPGSTDMALVDGYFGTADAFEFQSRHMVFRRGFGMPGMVWESGMPVLMNDLGRSRRFVRNDDAQSAGITRGIGIPCGRDGDGNWVVTLLSALATPIAQRFECWVPNDDDQTLRLASVVSETTGDETSVAVGTCVPAASGTLGKVWLTGTPVITSKLSHEPEVIAASASKSGLSTMVAMPVISQCAIKAVVAWYE